MNKKLLIRFVIFLSLAAGNGNCILYAQETVTPDKAIQAGAAGMAVLYSASY